MEGVQIVLRIYLGIDISVDTIIVITLIQEFEMEYCIKPPQFMTHNIRAAFPMVYREKVNYRPNGYRTTGQLQE